MNEPLPWHNPAVVARARNLADVVRSRMVKRVLEGADIKDTIAHEVTEAHRLWGLCETPETRRMALHFASDSLALQAMVAKKLNEKEGM